MACSAPLPRLVLVSDEPERPVLGTVVAFIGLLGFGAVWADLRWAQVVVIGSLAVPSVAALAWDLARHGWRERFPERVVVVFLVASFLALLSDVTWLRVAGPVGAFFAVFALGVNAWTDQQATRDSADKIA